jgi:hypothetical protein
MKKFIPKGVIRVPPTGNRGVVGEAKKIDRMKFGVPHPTVLKGRRLS